jgi:hypothetical protein
LIELTTTAVPSSPSRLTASSAASKLPSTMNSRAPAASAWASLPRATLPAGRMTWQGSPAAAAYAAAEAEVLPVDAHDGRRTGRDRPVHGQHHAPVLEASGRVGPLELEVQVPQAKLRAEASGVDQRRSALAECYRKRLAVARQQIAVALEQRGGRGRIGHAGEYRSAVGAWL